MAHRHLYLCTPDRDDLLDFVNRIEVIYAWSQILRNPDVELPGRQFLAHLLHVDRWIFSGPKWKKLCDVRRDSTALTAAITYGPGLKALGWVTPHAKYPRLLFATEDADPALNAFESVIADRLNHPAFSQFGAVEVKTSEARTWSESWALESPTDAEKRVMANMLLGTRAPPSRRNGCALMIAAVKCASGSSTRIRPSSCFEVGVFGVMFSYFNNGDAIRVPATRCSFSNACFSPNAKYFSPALRA